jgi:membrane protein DedA with SNARE-associated domain
MFDVAGLASLAAWAYVVVFGLSALDAVFPVLPSESIVIAASALATTGDLDPWAIGAAAAAGALVGDVTSFGLGRVARRRWRDPGEVRGRPGRLLAWAGHHLEARGEQVIITARFVPGGRTATTFSAGYLGLRRRRFLRAAALGAVLWAANGVTLGYVGGQVSEDPLVAMAGGLALGGVVSVAIHLVQRRRGAASAPRRVGLGGREDDHVAAEDDVAGPVDVTLQGLGDGVDRDGLDVVGESLEGHAGRSEVDGRLGGGPGRQAAAEGQVEVVGDGGGVGPPGALEERDRRCPVA